MLALPVTIGLMSYSSLAVCRVERMCRVCPHGRGAGQSHARPQTGFADAHSRLTEHVLGPLLGPRRLPRVFVAPENGACLGLVGEQGQDRVGHGHDGAHQLRHVNVWATNTAITTASAAAATTSLFHSSRVCRGSCCLLLCKLANYRAESRYHFLDAGAVEH